MPIDSSLAAPICKLHKQVPIESIALTQKTYSCLAGRARLVDFHFVHGAALVEPDAELVSTGASSVDVQASWVVCIV